MFTAAATPALSPQETWIKHQIAKLPGDPIKLRTFVLASFIFSPHQLKSFPSWICHQCRPLCLSKIIANLHHVTVHLCVRGTAVSPTYCTRCYLTVQPPVWFTIIQYSCWSYWYWIPVHLDISRPLLSCNSTYYPTCPYGTRHGNKSLGAAERQKSLSRHLWLLAGSTSSHNFSQTSPVISQ